MDTLTQKNKKIVEDFYYAYGIEKNVEKCRTFFGDTYIQHNPHVQDGVDHFLRFVNFRHTHYNQGRNNPKLVIAEGDKVMIHVHSVLTPGEPGRNLVDTFRVEDGKVIEHWDVIENIDVLKFPPNHDNGFFNEQGANILTDLDKTAENKKLVTEFYHALAVEKDCEKVAAYVSDDFIEHHPKMLDGKASLLNLVAYRKERFPNARNEIKVTVAEGNLVGFHVYSVLGEGAPERNLVDIFRVENGKIAEHWGTAQNIETLLFPPINNNGLY